MLLIKYDINRKKEVDKNNALKLDININNCRKYGIKSIQNSVFYIEES